MQAANGEKIYVIIDDYDRFAGFLAKGPDACARESPSARWRLDYIKAFYAVLKQFFGQDDDSKPIERIFLTGVAAVSLDSLTSGFNIATDISDLPLFSSMAGFTRGELSQVVDEAAAFGALKGISKAGAMEAMERRCGGYAFSEYGSERLFNPASCRSFLGKLLASGSIQEASKTAGCCDAERLRQVLDRCLPRARKRILDSVAGRDALPVRAPGALMPGCAGQLGLNEAVWTLAYSGFLTVDPQTSREFAATCLRCPNESVRSMFLECASNQG